MAIRGIPFHRYFKAVNRIVYECILHTIEHPTQQHFHRLRINLKRIRFIHRLLRRYEVKGASRFIKPYTKLFKTAGIIRQLHLHMQLVSAYGKNPEQDQVLNDLHKQELKAVKLWPKRASTCLAEMIAGQNSFEKAISKIEVTMAVYSNDLKSRVRHRFTNELREGKFHKSRKLLKEIVYSREISSALNARLAATYHFRTVLTLEDAIGDWHDLDLLLLHGLPHQHRLTKKIRNALKTKRNQEFKKINE